MGTKLVWALLFVLSPIHAQAQPTSAPPQNTAAGQLEEDPYTRYELLDPRSGKFRILYQVTAHEPGATSYFNPIRKGSIASDESMTDLATGKPLKFRVISGKMAQAEGLNDADPEGDYLQVTLARPVPVSGGEGRILIDKTYEVMSAFHPLRTLAPPNGIRCSPPPDSNHALDRRRRTSISSYLGDG